MLLRLELENVGAFQQRVILSLDAPATTDADVRDVPFTPRVPVVALVYGANASGKTTLLDGLARLVHAVRYSHRQWDPNGGTNANPFLLCEDPMGKPSEWRVQFSASDDAGVAGIYEYELSMDPSRVRGERLRFKSSRTGRWRQIYSRMDEVVQSPQPSIRALTPRLRSNALLLSLARQENVPSASRAWDWLANQVQLARNLSSDDMREYTLDRLVSSAELPIVRQLAARADLGISDVRGVPLTAADRDEFIQLSRRLAEVMPNLSAVGTTGEFRELEFAHSGAGGARYWLSQFRESVGTQAFLAAGLLAAKALATGGVLVIDELDGSLHPSLVEAVVDAFRSTESNPLGAQLIASSHDTHLFGRNSLSPLSRHEVWFTEKGLAGSAQLFRLSDFRDVRSDVDQEHHYLAGRYGAVPTPDLSAWDR
jgi:uncharacterized protein